MSLRKDCFIYKGFKERAQHFYRSLPLAVFRNLESRSELVLFNWSFRRKRISPRTTMCFKARLPKKI